MHWLSQFDLSLFQAINVSGHRSWLDPFMLAVTYTGLGQIQVAAALVFLIHRATRRYVLPVLVVFAVSGLLNDVVKQLVGRDRPSNLALALPQEPHLLGSYPSGHSVTSFAIACLLLIATWRTKNAWVGCAALAWAVLVGYSRIYRGVHWPTDVMGAAGLGLACACLTALAFHIDSRPAEG